MAYLSLDGGLPKVTSINPLDLPDDFFRIRLICNLLEKCGAYFVKGLAKKKLDFFLVFFQVFIVCWNDHLKLTLYSTTSLPKNPCQWTLSSWFKMPTL